MEVEAEQVKPGRLPSPPPSPTTVRDQQPADGAVTAKHRGSTGSIVVKRNGSLRREVHRKGSLRRDQRTGEKRRSRTGSLGSLLGYEAKFPVSMLHSVKSRLLATQSHRCRISRR